MAFDTMLGGQSPKTGNAEPQILYAPDGITPLNTQTFGPNKDLAVYIDNVNGSYVDGVDGQTLPLGAGIRGWLSQIYKLVSPGTAQTQAATHAVNTIVLPAQGANLRNAILSGQIIPRGTGTALSQTNQFQLTLQDGVNTIFSFHTVAFGSVAVPSLQTFPVVGSPNTSMTISCPDLGASNSSDINIITAVMYIP